MTKQLVEQWPPTLVWRVRLSAGLCRRLENRYLRSVKPRARHWRVGTTTRK